MKMNWLLTCLLGLSSLLLATSGAFAQAIVTDVIDAADENDPVDINIQIRFEQETISGNINREFVCQEGQGCDQNEIETQESLDFSRTIRTLHIHPKLGIYHDLELGVDIPIVLQDQTKLNVASEVLAKHPSAAEQEAYSNIGSLLPLDSAYKHVGPGRSGVGDLELALQYAPFNYERDETEPTWVLRLGYTLPTATVRTGKNTAVGGGLHALDLSTAISRRVLHWLEPYFSFHGTFRFPGAGSLFTAGDKQTLTQPGNIVGIKMGTEFIPWEEGGSDADPLRSARLEFDLGFAADFVFEGREYTPLFEALDQQAKACQDQGPGTCEELFTTQAPAGTGNNDFIYKDNGITDVEQYGIFKTWLGFHYQPVRYVQFGVVYGFNVQTDHFLTNADPGTDIDGINGVTDDEFSETYLEALDAPAGHQSLSKEARTESTRFRQEGYQNHNLMVHMTAKF